MNDIHTQCNNNAIKSLKRQNQRILQKSLTNCSNILPDDSIQCSPNGDAGPPTKRLSGTKVDPTTNGVGQTSKPADYCQKEREREPNRFATHKHHHTIKQNHDVLSRFHSWKARRGGFCY